MCSVILPVTIRVKLFHANLTDLDNLAMKRQFLTVTTQIYTELTSQTISKDGHYDTGITTLAELS